MAEMLQWPLEGLREAFAEVLTQGLAYADFDAKVVWIPNAIKYNAPQSKNVVISWREHWNEIPECELKLLAYERLEAFLEAFRKAFAEAFRKACPKPSPKLFRLSQPGAGAGEPRERREEYLNAHTESYSEQGIESNPREATVRRSGGGVTWDEQLRRARERENGSTE